MKQLRNVAVLLMLVSLVSLSPLMAQPQFEVPLTVGDGVTTYTLYLGFVPGADNCINTADGFNGHFEAFLPPAPPGGVFDARLTSPRTAQAATCYDQGSLVDFRPPGFYPSGRDSFRVKSQLGSGATMTISWPAGLAAYFTGLTLRYFDGSGNVNVDMLTTTTADVTLAGDPATVNIFSAGLILPAPGFSVTPGTVAFGSVGQGASKVDSVVVSNPGAGALNITSVTSNNAVFTFLPAGPQTIPPLGSLKYYITFSPTAVGPQSGTITFNHNATGSPGTVAVSGTGAAAPLAFEIPTTVTDGVTTYNLYWGLYPTANICIVGDSYNGHTEAFLPPPPPGGVFDTRLTSPRTAQAATCYDQGSMVDFRPSPTIPQTVAQFDTFRIKSQLGSGATMVISWSPTFIQQFSAATLRYFDGSGNVNVDMKTTFTADVTLAGDPSTVNIFTRIDPPVTNTDRRINVAPTTVPFGNVVVGNTSVQTVTVANDSGGGVLNISAVNSSNPLFTVLPAPPQNIPSGGSTTFSITFAPTALGLQNGTVTFVNDGTLPSLTGNVVNVSGTGIPIPPCFTAVPNPLNFGFVIDSTVVTLPVTVTNGDPLPMVVTNVTSSDPAFTVTPTSVTIPPGGGTQVFTVQFAPLDPTPPVAHSSTISFIFTGPSCSPGILTATGTSYVPGGTYYTTVPPETLAQWAGRYYQRPVTRNYRTPNFPNWANLLYETVYQGGFRPGATESDSMGGMRVGLSSLYERTPGVWWPTRMTLDTGWVRLSRWLKARSFGYSAVQIQNSLLNNYRGTIYTHNAFSRGIDSTFNPGDARRRALRGEHPGIYPRLSRNKLFGELVALKFNIAASALGKIPAGLGDAVITIPGPLNGLTLVAASRKVDSAMTLWKGVPQSFFNECADALAQINRACVGKLDTIRYELPPPAPPAELGSWYANKNLKIVGVAPLPGILIGPTAPLTTMVPMNLGSEAPDVEGEEDFLAANSDAAVPSVKLYQNYPNPFNPSTSISFNLLLPARVTLKIYNVLGQEVGVLLQDEEVLDGLQFVNFNAASLSSGVYYYMVTGQDLESGAAIPQTVGKMLLLK